jgi:hypothetical protein
MPVAVSLSNPPPAATPSAVMSRLASAIGSATPPLRQTEPVPHDRIARAMSGEETAVASYSVNPDGVAWAQHLIDSGQYVLSSDWGKVQPRAGDQNAFLKSHSWEEYAQWHLGLTDGATDHTKARYAFVFGDFRRLHRMGIIACEYRAAEWRHKEIELAAHDLLQRLDRRGS